MAIILIVAAVIIVAVVLGIVIVAQTRPTGSAQPFLPPREARGGVIKFECQDCGAELDKDAISDRQGLSFVSCSYCGSTYQLLEEPV